MSDRADSLSAVGMGAGPRAGPVNGAGAGQGGRPGASQTGHTGGGHWEVGEGNEWKTKDSVLHLVKIKKRMIS